MNEFRRKNKCFFFTLFYPYTHQGVSYDSYIYSEVEKISKKFDAVQIIAMGREQDGHSVVSSNVSFANFSAPVTLFDKFFCARFFLSALFWNELEKFKKHYSGKINFSIIKAVLLFLVKADKYKSYLESQFSTIDFKETDVVIYNYWTFENSLASTLLKKNYPVKVYTRMHSLDLYFDRVPENYLPFRKLVYDLCDAVFFVSEQGKNYFNRVHQIEKQNQHKGVLNRIGVVNNYALNMPSFQKIVLLSNAWIQPLKRIELIIESLALIDDFEIEWLHIGDDYGTGRFEAVKNLAIELLGNKKNVYYEFVGRKSQQEVYEILSKKKVNLFVNVSTTEGIPVSIMEALSFGVPVIATKVGGVPEIIEDGENGFLLAAEISAADVARKISDYNSMSSEAKVTMANNARRIWNEKFNADKNSGELIRNIT